MTIDHRNDRRRIARLFLWRGAALLLGLTIGVTACSWPGLGSGDNPQARGARWARRIFKSMGGQRALGRIRYLNFEFVVTENGKPTLRRRHLWDRRTGRYRIEGRHEGTAYLALLNVNTRQGRVMLGYPPRLAPGGPEALDRAFSDFQSDTYWLMAATGLFDAGTHLQYVGEPPLEGERLPTLFVTFDPAAAPPPGDRIWFRIDPATGLPRTWSLAQGPQKAPPATYAWTQWQRVGGFDFPVRFEQRGGSSVVSIEGLYAPDEVEDRVFEKFE